MANGYAKPNYTQLPNALLDHHLAQMKESELKVVMAIARATFGWHKESAKLSLSQLEEKTGMTRQGVINGTQAGIDRGVIMREPDGQGFIYALVVDGEVVNEIDQSTKLTSLRNRLEVVNEIDQGSQRNRLEVVNDVDQIPPTLKKVKERTTKKRKKPLVDLDTRASGVVAHATPPTSDMGWSEFVSAYCKACYRHSNLDDLTEPQKMQLLAEAKRVRSNGYTVEDLRLWWQKCWAVDRNFKWRKNKESPTPVDIRTGIAALTAIKAEMMMLHEAMDLPSPVIERALPLTPQQVLWKQLTTDYAQLHDATLVVEDNRWVIITIMADWCRVQLTHRIERDLKHAGVVATVEFAMKEQVTP